MDALVEKNAPLDLLLERTGRKNKEIARISGEVDAAMAPSFEAAKTNQSNILSAAEKELAEDANALKLCSEKAIADMDERLTGRLYRLYCAFEGKENDGEEERT